MQPNLASGESADDDWSAVTEELLLVSNRQPYRHRYADDGDVTVDRPAGGLASGIDPVMQRTEGTWIAWGDGEADFTVADEDSQVDVPPNDPAYTLQRLDLSEREVRGYYDGYANQALWPLCHSATGRINFEAEHWDHYQAVNDRFADAVAEHADDESTVWFQDYHFTLAPSEVADRVPGAFLMHFFHIPWPAPDVFRLCPQAERHLDGLLGNDLLGFHSPHYCTQFLRCVDELLDDATVDWGTGTVTHCESTTRVESFPLGVDADAIRQETASADDEFWPSFRAEAGIDSETTVAIGVDRLDYTKGIPERIDALERLFETRPGLQGELTYVQKGAPTRERVPAYQRLREEIEQRIDEVNDRFGTDDWSPIAYTTEMYDRPELFSLYRHSDIALVGPLRDGMNLVAKEYVAAQLDDDGVLLLSPFTGAAEQLGDSAVEFDPYDTAGAADAIEAALRMDRDQRRTRMHALRRQVHEADLQSWLDDVLSTAAAVRASEHHVSP